MKSPWFEPVSNVTSNRLGSTKLRFEGFGPRTFDALCYIANAATQMGSKARGNLWRSLIDRFAPSKHWIEVEGAEAEVQRIWAGVQSAGPSDALADRHHNVTMAVIGAREQDMSLRALCGIYWDCGIDLPLGADSPPTQQGG